MDLVPGAQIGSLYPFIQQTAAASPLELSYLHDHFTDLEAWKAQGRAKLLELLRYSPPTCDPAPEIVERVQCDGYVREKLYFNTTPDIRVPAFMLIPDDLQGPAPAVVALHDHGAFFAWGKEKICEIENENPALTEFKRTGYDGRSWASEMARRGYVVICIDMFYWGERRLLLSEDPPAWRDPQTMTAEEVRAFNIRSSEFTVRTAIGLFEAGITWSGVMFTDDLRTVDYLLTRPEVDPERIGCCGLSVGGFRCAHLAGLHPKIKCACVVGWMCSYGAMLKEKLTSIGFMKIVPGLYQYMDLPDVVSMTGPGALMCIQGTRDGLFTNEGVQEAYRKIAAVYQKAGVSERFEGVTYDGPHEFNLPMQEKAFEWFNRWL
ncbi:MAG: dienelactone hydrolase family protein [Armatimonadota bacterium]